ncbi:MAG: HAD hydrolase family protein, partial [Thermofilum sp.]
ESRRVATAQLFGGKILADVTLDERPTVIAALAGAFAADAVNPGAPGQIERRDAPAELAALRTRSVVLERPEAADVDITRAEKIVAVGDSEVDVSMFEKSDVSVALANAPEEVKAKATYVTRRAYGEGFIEAAELLIRGDL